MRFDSSCRLHADDPGAHACDFGGHPQRLLGDDVWVSPCAPDKLWQAKAVHSAKAVRPNRIRPL